MAIVLDGTTGISTPAETVSGTGVWSVGGTQIYKDASGNVGIGTGSPATYGKFVVRTTTDKDGINVLFDVGPTASNGGSLNFWNATNTAYVKQGMVETICTDGSASYGSALTFSTAGSGTLAERMRLDSSGNLGLGVTPSAWESARKVFQFGTQSALNGQGNNTQLTNNYYANSGGTATYIGTGYAQRYNQDATGAHVWQIAPSGTAGGTISLTQAMTLDASGNLGIGTTSPLSNSLSFVRGASTNASIEIAGNGNTPGSTSFSLIQAGDNVAYIYNRANGPIIFGTNNTERARIDSSGVLLINATAKVSSTTYFSVQGATGASNISEWKDTGTSYASGNYYQVYWNSANGVAGGIAHTAASTVAFNTSSDARLKENIVDAPDALAQVLATKVRSYDWKEDGHHVTYGLIAQELYEQLPEAVGKGDDAEVIENPNGTWQVEYGRLTPMLIKAIQEQQAIITSLTERLTALENK